MNPGISLPTKRGAGAVNIDPKFIYEKSGVQVVKAYGLISAAHQVGLASVVTTVVQLPSSDNHDMTIVRAEATFDDGSTFTGIGDASPANVGPQVRLATVRIAETRAIVRALRVALAIDLVTEDELMAETEAPRGASSRPSMPTPSVPAPAAKPVMEPGVPFGDQGENAKGTPIWKLAQQRVAVLCTEHMKDEKDALRWLYAEYDSEIRAYADAKGVSLHLDPAEDFEIIYKAAKTDWMTRMSSVFLVDATPESKS